MLSTLFTTRGRCGERSVIYSLFQECPTYGPRARRATIWPARRFYPARKMSEMIDLCLSGVQALKYAKTLFLPRLHPGPRWGSLRCFPRPPSRLERGKPLPIPFYLDAFIISFWPLTTLKFVHLALRSKWTPLVYSVLTIERSRSKSKVKTAVLKMFHILAIARLWFTISSPNLAIRHKWFRDEIWLLSKFKMAACQMFALCERFF